MIGPTRQFLRAREDGSTDQSLRLFPPRLAIHAGPRSARLEVLHAAAAKFPNKQTCRFAPRFPGCMLPILFRGELSRISQIRCMCVMVNFESQGLRQRIGM